MNNLNDPLPDSVHAEVSKHERTAVTLRYPGRLWRRRRRVNLRVNVCRIDFFKVFMHET